MNRASRNSPRPLLLLTAAVGIELCFISLHLIPATAVLLFLSAMALAFIAYAVAVLEVIRRPAASRGLIIAIFGISALFHLTLWKTEPLFDDDLHRYAWDGKVAKAGHNPYLHPPNSLDLIDLWRKDQYKIPYDEVPTIYPPLTQAVFFIAATVQIDSWAALKAAFSLLHLAGMGALLLLLRALERPSAWVLIQAWSPLALKEVANSGHMDALLVLTLVLTALALVKRHDSGAVAGLAAATLTKLVPLVLIPLVFLRLRRKAWFLLYPILLLVAYLPFYDAGLAVFDGLRVYGEFWTFNPGLFELLHALARGIGSLHALDQLMDPLLLAKLFASSAVAAVAFYTGWRARQAGGDPVISALFWTLATLLLVGPTVDPWYLLWILPWLCVKPSGAFLLWTGLVSLSYVYYLEDRDIVWVRSLEYGLFALALCIESIRRRARSRARLGAAQGSS